MANFAALIDVLSIAGSRLSDGTANDSGKVWFFQPGTNTPVNVYSDAAASAIVTAPVTLNEGGLVSTADYPDGIFATQPIRLYIEDSDASEVADLIYIPATAGNVGVSNAGWTATTMDEVLTALTTSTGGDDGTYLESAGATERTIKAKFAEIWISVKDFGAAGDGIAIDKTAVQAAINRVKALGGGVVYFPPGTYLIDGALTLASGTGIRFVGAGMGSTTIKSNHATANIFSLTSCTFCGFSDINLTHVTSTTGSGVSLDTCTDVAFNYFGSDGTTASGKIRYPINLSSTSRVLTNGCLLYAAGAAGRGILLTSSSTVTVIGGVIAGGGYALEFAGTSSTFEAVNVSMGTAISGSVLFAAAATGTKFTFVGGAYTDPAITISTATFRDIRTFGTGIDGYTEDVVSAGTFTPNLALGRHFRMRVTSTGAAITIAAPTPTPITTMYGLTIILDVFNNAGGAISNAYTVNAAYHLTTVPNQTDTNHNVYTLLWDPSASVWRQLSLSVTT